MVYDRPFIFGIHSVWFFPVGPTAYSIRWALLLFFIYLWQCRQSWNDVEDERVKEKMRQKKDLKQKASLWQPEIFQF